MKLVSIEKAFIEACDKHPHLKLLESQWRFDKELISKALQNISSIFPHYSRHDASHSKQIIVNIERLLGDRISHLTATDIWLILEAAYTHDIGMVITHKQIQDLDTPEFSIFVRDIASQHEHSLNIFATQWIEETANLPTGADAHAFFNKYIQLISEWYRRKHPENSAKIVRDPYTEIGLDSPRNELLPKRLFGTLAAICKAHGESFEEVIKLPFSEAGMATEDCHPRYVAFLLRMGDLLDIDDNRFCPVMMRMNGSSLPSESHTHYEKHQSIRHFRLDSDRIEIKVVCPSPESYEQAHQWFKWLEDEHYKQSQHWHKIVPSKKLGRLPTLSSPDVSIEKPFLTIEKGKKPRFKVDESAALKLLRSTGLYSSKAESIREILQNAVDSTLLAIWSKHENTINKLNPTDTALYELYDEHRIHVDFVQDPNELDIFWLSVTDHGTGISEEDLRFMLQVGSSSKNKSKSKLKQGMPNWYKPSGNFGIGLQSVYLLSDSFSITTKSIVTNEALEINFSSGKEQSVVIKSLDPNTIDYGATVKVRIRIEGFPETISIPYGKQGESLRKKLCEYDFTRANSSLRGYEQVAILSAIHDFNADSPIKLCSSVFSLTSCREEMFFSRTSNTLLRNVTFGSMYSSSFHTLFRGQPFNGLSPSLELASCVIDYYGHQALDFLSYNREKILSQAKRQAVNELIASLLEYIETKFDEIPLDQKPYAAAFHFLHSTTDNPKYETHLNQYTLSVHNKPSYTLNDILTDIKGKKIQLIELKDNNSSAEPPTDVSVIVLDKILVSSSMSLIKHFATKSGMFWQERIGYTNSNRSFAWSDQDIQPVSNDRFKQILNGNTDTFEVGNRLLFPAWDKYRKLALNVEILWARKYPHAGANTEHLVLPCSFGIDQPATIEVDDTFLSWTYANRKHLPIDFKEFSSLYMELIDHLKNIAGK
jgi:hypothetical protein